MPARPRARLSHFVYQLLGLGYPSTTRPLPKITPFGLIFCWPEWRRSSLRPPLWLLSFLTAFASLPNHTDVRQKQLRNLQNSKSGSRFAPPGVEFTKEALTTLSRRARDAEAASRRQRRVSRRARSIRPIRPAAIGRSPGVQTHSQMHTECQVGTFPNDFCCSDRYRLEAAFDAS